MPTIAQKQMESTIGSTLKKTGFPGCQQTFVFKTIKHFLRRWLNSAEQGKAAEMSYCRKWFLKRSTLLDIQVLFVPMYLLFSLVHFVLRNDAIVR